MEKSELQSIAKTMWRQIVGTVGFSVPMSWGISAMYAVERECRDGMLCPCLMIFTNGLLHTGWVCVAYNEGVDTYEVSLLDENANYKEWHTNLFFDELGFKIDSLVERKNEWTDDEYHSKAMADSDKKMAEEYG